MEERVEVDAGALAAEVGLRGGSRTGSRLVEADGELQGVLVSWGGEAAAGP